MEFLRKSLKVIKKIKKFTNQHIITGTKGVISLLLSILMVPFVSIAAGLVSLARINSATAIFDESLCNASNSTLGTYDSFLRKRFGLMAISQSSVATDFSYTQEDFINDTFKKYMEENLKSLSNTYQDTELQVNGVLPLADKDVMLSEILENAKYSVPTKMVIDGLSIDAMLNKLTSGCTTFMTGMGAVSSELGAIEKFNELDDNLSDLKTELGKCEGYKADYISKYAPFRDSVKEYNELVDKMNEELEPQITARATALQENQAIYPTYVDLGKQIKPFKEEADRMAGELDSDGNHVYDDDDIKQYWANVDKDHDNLKTRYDYADGEVNRTYNEWNTADKEVKRIEETYHASLDTKRGEVSTARQNYEDILETLHDSLVSIQGYIKNAQTALKDAITKTVETGVKTAETMLSADRDAQKQNIKDLEEKKNQAILDGDTAEEARLEAEIESKKQTLDDDTFTDNSWKAGADAKTAVPDAVYKFANDDDYITQIDAAEKNIGALYTKVKNYTVVTTYDKMAVVTDDEYFVEFSIPVTSDQIDQLINDTLSRFKQEDTGTSIWNVIKLIIKFIKALMKPICMADPMLISYIDSSKYDDIGGLPSEKRKRGVSLESGFEDIDRAKSDEYKQILGKYSDANLITNFAIDDLADLFTAIIDDIENISNDFGEMHFGNIFRKIYDIGCHVKDLVVHINSAATLFAELVAKGILSKTLLAGYLGYNTANRTTYEKKPLNGGTYKLPSVGDAFGVFNDPEAKDEEIDVRNLNLAFYGCETEYLLIGSKSEYNNQLAIYGIIFFIRLLINIPVVFCSEEVETVAAAVAAASFGIGEWVVYLLYIVAEPLADSMVLVGGSEVPIIKNRPFLTPSGIPTFVGKLATVTLTDNMKDSLFKDAREAADPNGTSNLPTNLKAADKMYGKDSSLCLDYTQHLIILMMMWDQDTLLDRFCDIVQMESTYNSKFKYIFDLDKSYTYIRSAGKFKSDEFIKVISDNGLTSTERIIYRGY